MSNSRFIFYFSCIIFLLFRCAYRDNHFDPQSPLYRATPPELSVVLLFDSSKISFSSNDTFYAFTPLDLTISASAKGGARQDTDLDILYLHYINGNEEDKDLIEDSIHLVLQDSGTHLLEFQTTEKTGSETTIEQKVFILHHKSGPRIINFLSNEDTLFTGKDYTVQFTTEVFDSNNLLKELIYVISPSDNVRKSIGTHSSRILDTLSYRFFNNDTGKKTITLKAIDILEREHSMSLDLIFKENPPYYPPVINSITYEPHNISVMQEVDFMVNYTSFTEKTSKYFFFGEYGSAIWTTESSHHYNNPGIYKVYVKVVDDSGSSDIDSIFIQVTPIANKPPQISNLVITPDSGDSPLKVHFSVLASDSDGEFIHYKWILGTGHEFFAASEFVFTYWYAGKYPVTVIAYDDKWATDTISDTIIVTGDSENKTCLAAYPVPAFTYQEVYFKLENAPKSYDNAIYYWDFPKRGPELGSASKEFRFQLDGEYEVKLSVFLKDTVHEYSVPVKIIMPKF